MTHSNAFSLRVAVTTILCLPLTQDRSLLQLSLIGADGFQHVSNLFESPLHFGVGNDIRRHEVNHITKRAQKQAALNKSCVQLWAKAIEVAAAGLGFLTRGQFHNSHAADYADVANGRQHSEGFESGAKLLLKSLNACKRSTFGEQVETGDCHGTGQRISGVGVSVEEGFGAVMAEESLVDGLSRGCRAEGEIASGKRL